MIWKTVNIVFRFKIGSQDAERRQEIMITVSICIASVGRPSLLETLRSIADGDIPEEFQIEVVIADDSNCNAVEKLLASHSFPFTVHVHHAGARNVAVARNICLHASKGAYLLFIDDDQLADSGWMKNLVEQAESIGADAVFGPVNAIYPTSAPDWMRKAGPFSKRTGPHGSVLDGGSSGNSLVRRSTISRLNLTFREEFGKSGGEDTDFFSRLHRLGGKLIASDTALVYEQVPESRLELADLRRRYTRGGQTYAIIALDSTRGWARLQFYSAALLKITIAALIVAGTLPIRKDLAMRYAFKLWLNLGKLRHMMGLPLFQIY